MNAETKSVRPEKEALVAEVRDGLAEAHFIFLADYQGLNMEQTTELRQRLRKAGGRMQVVRNNLLRRAAREASREAVAGELDGPTAMIVGAGDPVEVAKALIGFAKGNEKPVPKGGALEGRAITADDVRALAAMPPRPVLLGQFLGTLAAPMTQLAGVMQQKLTSIVYVLKAVQEKREEAQG